MNSRFASSDVAGDQQTRSQCQRCVMDSTASNLALDARGLCTFCRRWDALVAAGAVGVSEEQLRRQRQELLDTVRAAGRGKRYDCVVGLSGGADSSYALHLAVREGLRPLVVHVDNGWNSELAVMNIEALLRGLGVDLYTVLIRWEEFRDLQLAFLRADVVDLEMPSDHAIIAGTMRTAMKFGIRYVLSGDNHSTETSLPPNWNHRKLDLPNLLAIHDAYSKTPLRSYPMLSSVERYARQWQVQWRPFLSLYPYVKSEAIAELSRRYGFRPYVGKHGESIITRFYQGYILPVKFGIDKRKLHLSQLICSGQITRAQALEELGKPHYDPAQMRIDREFVIKKFRLTEREFDEIMRRSPRAHEEFASDERVFEVWRAVRSVARRAIALGRGGEVARA